MAGVSCLLQSFQLLCEGRGEVKDVQPNRNLLAAVMNLGYRSRGITGSGRSLRNSMRAPENME